MSLTDVMSSLKLVSFAQVALVIFFCAFVAIVVWVLLRPKREIDRAARLPLERDDSLPAARSSGSAAADGGESAGSGGGVHGPQDSARTGKQGSGR